MDDRTSDKTDAQKAASIVAAAGGRLVGRTRLQKLACLFELAGMGNGFRFHYYHYGPYCEELALGIREAALVGLLGEKEQPASWGGTYSVFTTSQLEPEPMRQVFAEVAVNVDAVVLELVATAAFLSVEGCTDPWDEARRRKRDKAAGGRLEKARVLYRQLTGLSMPRALPAI
jgi:uncharacterized protein